MSKTIKTEIEVEISNIDVDERNFSFDYIIKVNGKENISGEIQDDHTWAEDYKSFIKVLEDRYATELALNQIDL